MSPSIRTVCIVALVGAPVLPATAADDPGGGDDDILRALDTDGGELWTAQWHVSETSREGDGWYAPWFTAPERRSGIRSLMVADLGAGPEIALGRPSTVEFWSLDAKLTKRRAVTDLAICTEGVVAGLKNGRVVQITADGDVSKAHDLGGKTGIVSPVDGSTILATAGTTISLFELNTE
jgi:hypothetical protein